MPNRDDITTITWRAVPSITLMSCGQEILGLNGSVKLAREDGNYIEVGFMDRAVAEALARFLGLSLEDASDPAWRA